MFSFITILVDPYLGSMLLDIYAVQLIPVFILFIIQYILLCEIYVAIVVLEKKNR